MMLPPLVRILQYFLYICGPDMNESVKSAIKYLLSFLLMAVVLYYSFKGISWEEFWAALENCRWGWIAVAFALGVFVQYVRGLRWRMLLTPIDPSITRLTAFNAINICMLFNLVLPRAGEVVRCGYITRNSRRDDEGKHLASFDKVVGTVLVERAWDIVSIVVIMVMAMAVMWKRFGPYVTENVLPALSQKTGLALIAALAILLVAVAVLLIRAFRDKSRLCGKICSVFSGLGEGLTSCLHMKGGWLFILYTILIWVIYWLMISFAMLAVKDLLPGLGMSDALFIMFAGAVSGIVPVPGGFGVFHGAVAGAISTVYGFPFSTGMIFATLSHESEALVQLLTGLVSYIYESVKKI